MNDAAGALRGLDQQLDQLVEDTPEDRDRYVDFLRAAAIGVVIVWHWVLSMTHRQDGELVMPNPLDAIPGAWLVTWGLQVMPLFFFVGGFANLATWESIRRDGGGAVEFWRGRARRLLLPAVALVVVWAAFDGIGLLLIPGYRSVITWGMIAFMPLWFLAAYVWVVALVPLTARLHVWGGVLGLTLLALPLALVDLGRFRLEVEWLGYVNSALVWVFVHQLGYFYRDGTLGRIGWRGQTALAMGAIGGLIVLTSLPVYPRSMVATRELDFSHMWPTTAVIAVVALLQAAVAMLLLQRISRWLRRRSVWKAVIAVNAVIMTLFVWHMTAKIVAVGVWEAVGFRLLDEPTALWWAQRPVWLLLPALFLLPLVAVFARLEIGRRT